MNKESPAGPKPRRGRAPGASAGHAQRREEIIDAAVAIFSAHGYVSASFDAVARAVGLTLPGLLHYFPRKADLLLAVLERRDREARELVQSGPPDWRRMLDMLVQLNRRNARIPTIIQFFSLLSTESLSPDHPAHEWFRARSRDTVESFADVLAEGVRQGSIRPEIDPGALATEISAMMDGLQVWWLRDPEAAPLTDLFEAYVERLKHSIAASPKL